jgi:hypothetical protein
MGPCRPFLDETTSRRGHTALRQWPPLAKLPSGAISSTSTSKGSSLSIAKSCKFSASIRPIPIGSKPNDETTRVDGLSFQSRSRRFQWNHFHCKARLAFATGAPGGIQKCNYQHSDTEKCSAVFQIIRDEFEVGHMLAKIESCK